MLITPKGMYSMNDVEFRAVLDWRMCSDPFPTDVPVQVIDDWIEGECHERGYGSFAEAYHDHAPHFIPDDSKFGVGA